MYEAVGAIEKNKDSLSQNLLFVMKSKFPSSMVKMPPNLYVPVSEHGPVKYWTLGGILAFKYSLFLQAWFQCSGCFFRHNSALMLVTGSGLRG